MQEVGVRFMLPVSLKGFAYKSTAILNPDDPNIDVTPNQITLNDGTAGIETTLVYMTAPAAGKTYKQCLKKRRYRRVNTTSAIL